MRKTFLALACLAFVGAAPAAAYADYAAIAAGDGGYGWVDGGYRTMEGARTAAKRICRNGGYGSCESSVAERSGWYFSGGNCDGRTYVGASSTQWGADQMVRRKAARDGYGNCDIEVQF